MPAPDHDVVGYWSEVKLEIVKKYAQAYSAILAKQASIRRYLYIDGFAGPGVHLSRRTGQFILGSPLNALDVEPRFSEYHFIDLDGDRVSQLEQLTERETNTFCYQGDASSVLLDKVLPRAKWEEFHRALCLLDPYGLQLNWEVVREAGRMGSVEIFLNFPIMHMNRNVLRHDQTSSLPGEVARMNSFWGNESWREAYRKISKGLFEPIDEKSTNADIVKAYVSRLKDVAGFKYVPEPMPMRNSSGAVVYYLMFASPNNTGRKIVQAIFDSYRNRGIG